MQLTDGHDHDVAPGQQGRRGRVAQAVDLVVDRRVLLDVGVRRRDVGLGLVVVVVADEVLDRRRRQKLTELVAELGRQGLVVGDHQRRPRDVGDDARHREGLARARDPEQRLEGVAAAAARPRARGSPGAGRPWAGRPGRPRRSSCSHGEPSAAARSRRPPQAARRSKICTRILVARAKAAPRPVVSCSLRSGRDGGAPRASRPRDRDAGPRHTAGGAAPGLAG